MIRSMTGWGEAERESTAGRLRLEVKTVNHRFFNPSVKTPPGFDRFEPAIVEALKRHLKRGHVTAYLSVDRTAAAPDSVPPVDLDKARAYVAALNALQVELDLPGLVDIEMIAAFPDVFRAPERDRTGGVEPELIGAMTAQAAQAALELREAEGLRLENDLRDRLRAVSGILDDVVERAPQRLVEHRDRLRQAVRELTEQVDVDEERLAREIAYLAERWDVNEEIVRFRSHVELFADALSGDGAEPVGKRLGFLVQEMHREANTIGAKANDAEVTQSSLALKEEIERMREQVENVE